MPIVTADNLADLIEMDQGLGIDDIQQVLAGVSEPILGCIYNYVYVSDLKGFKQIVPIYKGEGQQPSLDNIVYSVQEFEKFKKLNNQLGNTEVDLEIFADFLQNLFEPEMDVTPFINYIQYKGLVALSGKDSILLV